MDMKFIVGLARDWGLALVVVVGIYMTWALLFSSNPISEGPAPDFNLPSVHGHDVQLSNYEDSTVVLNFWFTSCPPCRHEIPELSAFNKAHPEVVMFGISVDTMSTAQLQRASERLGISYEVLHDRVSHAANAYEVSVFPTTVVIKKGQIAATRVGVVDQAYLERLIN
jgi:peroxiredoxin